MAPSGGKIAITDSKGLRLLRFTSGTGITIISNQLLVGPNPNGSTPDSPDFSPDGSLIIFHISYFQTTPGAIRVVTTTGASWLDYSCDPCEAPHWNFSGDAFSFARTFPHGPNVPVDYEIWTGIISGSTVTASQTVSTTTQAFPFKAIDSFDTARTSNRLLIKGGNFVVGFDAGAITTIMQGSASSVHYNANDTQIIFRESVKGGSYISSLNLTTNPYQVTRLTAKGNYGLVDAKP